PPSGLHPAGPAGTLPDPRTRGAGGAAVPGRQVVRSVYRGVQAGLQQQRQRPRQPPGSERMTTIETVTAPRRKRRVFLWVFLAIQALFVAWLVTGLATVHTGPS